MKTGDIVQVDFIRSNHLDRDKGIGWWVYNATVVVNKFVSKNGCESVWFDFNGETKCLPADRCRVVKSLDLFSNIEYAKDDYFFVNKHLFQN